MVVPLLAILKAGVATLPIDMRATGEGQRCLVVITDLGHTVTTG